jgi:hypothetical protein
MGSYRRYLDRIARLRNRVRRLSLKRRRAIIGVVMFVLLGAVLAIEVTPFTLFLDTGRPSPRAVMAPNTGEVIIEKGEVVTSADARRLEALGLKRNVISPTGMLYAFVFALILIGAVAMYLAKFRRTYYDSPGLLLLLGSIFVVYAVAANLLAVAAWSWSPFWGYLMPTAAVGIIVAVLFDSGTALVASAICALLTGVVTSGSYPLAAFAFLAGFFPSLYAARTSTRHQLRRVGLYTAFWVALVAFAVTGLSRITYGLMVNTGIGFVNGTVCAIIAMGALPFLETTFRVTTHTWLLDLASPEQDLLRDLSVKAPGTYSHSVMVANLAEAAAREIGSDPLLARVASYYHDVGKIKRPQFFVENQPYDFNPHGGLSASLSTLIILSHVRDGVEMLRSEHFPPDLVEIIEQHHGTSLVRYFYDMAVAQDERPVEEGMFRYHMGKPHRRTAGILMLADSVEAAARTLQKPSAASIGQMVDGIVDGKLADGQLEESDLTYDDLAKTRNAFKRILIGTHHARIDYPAGVPGTVEDGRTNRGAGKKSA